MNKAGKTIIMTIHQPNSIIFEMLERIILLADGNVIYDDHSSKLKLYYESLGCQFPSYVNIMDYVMMYSSKQLYTNDKFIDIRPNENLIQTLIVEGAVFRDREINYNTISYGFKELDG